MKKMLMLAKIIAQLTFTCSNSTTEAFEKSEMCSKLSIKTPERRREICSKLTIKTPEQRH